MQSGRNPVPQTLARVEEKLDQLLRDRMTPSEVKVPPEQIYVERAARILDEAHYEDSTARLRLFHDSPRQDLIQTFF